MFKTSVFLILGAVLLALVSAAEENKTLPRPFGIGVGISYIGGRDTDKEGTQLSLKIYKQFINYKRLMKKSFEKDELYYERFTDTNTCIGGCTVESFCQSGLCICKHDEGWVQNWGRCFGNKSVSFAGNHEKYRKPRPPDLPTWCYCTQRNGGKEICKFAITKETIRSVGRKNFRTSLITTVRCAIMEITNTASKKISTCSVVRKNGGTRRLEERGVCVNVVTIWPGIRGIWSAGSSLM